MSDKQYDIGDNQPDCTGPEKAYTLADLEQARKQALDDAARTVLNWPLPTIQAPSMWLIDKHGIAADIRSLGPIGETREETERRVRRETVEKMSVFIARADLLQFEDEIDAIAEGK